MFSTKKTHFSSLIEKKSTKNLILNNITKDFNAINSLSWRKCGRIPYMIFYSWCVCGRIPNSLSMLLIVCMMFNSLLFYEVQLCLNYSRSAYEVQLSEVEGSFIILLVVRMRLNSLSIILVVRMRLNSLR